MEISDTATYTVRRNSPTERELTLVFDAPAPAGTAGSAAAKEDAALAAFGGETITLAQALVNGAPLAPPTDATTSSDAMSALKTSGTLAARATATPAPAGGAPAQPPAPAPAAPQSPAPTAAAAPRHRSCSRTRTRSPAARRRSTPAIRSAWTSRASICDRCCGPSPRSAASTWSSIPTSRARSTSCSPTCRGIRRSTVILRRQPARLHRRRHHRPDRQDRDAAARAGRADPAGAVGGERRRARGPDLRAELREGAIRRRRS